MEKPVNNAGMRLTGFFARIFGPNVTILLVVVTGLVENAASPVDNGVGCASAQVSKGNRNHQPRRIRYGECFSKFRYSQAV